ncbi:MAG: hypothetical protein PHQ23_15335, partial [Candidatus Wallbacteria bacterium]|nr:hypothetical protein [Candidatus Wallbacteria bacterium]
MKKIRFGYCRIRMLCLVLMVALFLLPLTVTAADGKLLIPMDRTQTNHLRAYGIAYHLLSTGEKAKWLLNYRGGSFLLPNVSSVVEKCLTWGVR